LIPRPSPQASLAALEQRCAAAGIPLTIQRRVVLEALVQRHDHPTVDQLYNDVVVRLPEMSRATVYRALETLEALGLLRRVEHAGSAVRFDGNIAGHHHFVCTRCGSIEDLPLEQVRGHRELGYVGDDGRIASEIAVSVRGLCARCAASG
jgi:Fur family peroxide stress response transcriptional regulator